MRIAALLLGSFLVLVLAQAGTSASHPVGWYCTPNATVVSFSNFPVDNVLTADGAATGLTFTTNGNAVCVDSITTTHISGDPGPGTLGLTPGSGALTGQGGPWPITAANGQWKATPSTGNDTAVIQGTYTCADSKPSTWTYFQGDAAKTGFCEVVGRVALADGIAPTITMSSPAAGALLSGTVRIGLAANDDGGSGLEHFAAQTSTPSPDVWTTRASSTQTLSWNTTNVPDGTYSLRAAAFDVAGNEGDSAPVAVTVDNTAPQLTLTCNTGAGNTACAPWVTQSVDVTATASDANGAGQIKYTTDGTPPLVSSTAQTYTGTLHVTQSQRLRFGVVDPAGNIADAQVGIDLTAPPAPNVQLAAGSNDSYLSGTNLWYRPAGAGPAILTVPANDDPDSGIASVSWPTMPAPWTITTNGLSATFTWGGATVGQGFGLHTTNTAGLTGADRPVNFQPDSIAPTGGITCVPASCLSTTGPVTVTLGATDTGSGIKQVRYTTDGTDPSATTGTVGSTLNVNAASTTVKFWAVDNVGNAGVVASASVSGAPTSGAFTVDTTADTHDARAGNGVCADANGACSIRAAVEESNALPAGSTISVPAGTYQLSIGGLDVQTGMTISGAGARRVTILGTTGARVFYVHSAADPVTISGFTLSGGTANAGNDFFGGNVRNEGNLTLREDRITNGSACSGGGVGNAGGTLLIDRSTISGNSAPCGGGDSGGVQNWGDNSTHHGRLTILNSTITGNTARLAGGVFDWNDAADTMTISNSTIAGNQGGDRGIGGVGIGNGSSATLQNTIVTGNTVGGVASNCSGAFTSGGHNLVGSDCTGFTASGDIVGGNAQLGSLQDNGGQTDTLQPALSSAAVDNGSGCPSVDQRGTSRPQGVRCDIGAVEVVRNDIVVTNTSDSGAGSLRQAILDANAQAGLDRITFAIPGAGVQTITPATLLPAITDAVIVDGYTQAGAQVETTAASGDTPPTAVLEIELSGATVGNNGAGLAIQGSGSTVRGLVINGGFTYGIAITGSAATGNTVAGNYIGTSADGRSANGLGIYGVVVNQNASGNTIGGTTPADRNVISGTTGISPGGGVGIGFALGASNNTAIGNLIGGAPNAIDPVPNATGVIVLSGAHDNHVGDGNKQHANLIVNNTVGVRLQQSGTTNNTVGGNFIGVDFVFSDGTRLLRGNGSDGVQVTESAAGNVVVGNVIANNGGNGVSVTAGGQARISANAIRNSGKLGIDLGGDGVTQNDAGDGDSGPNGLQNFPVITDAGSNGTISGTLDSTPNTSFTVEAFAVARCNGSGYGEGNATLGQPLTVQTDATGHAVWQITGSIADTAAGVTTTATDPNGNTSEFSRCFRLTQTGSALIVNSAADTNDGTCSASNCTLREAFNAANAHAGADTIRFAIGIGGPQTIQLTSPLPTLTEATTVDGTSQPGWVAVPIVTVNGAAAGAADGIRTSGAASVVRGLAVTGFGGIGIHVFGNGSIVAGNYSSGNSGDGIRVENADTVTVGGAGALDRNVVGGNRGHGIFLLNGHSDVVRGNYSGTDASGATANANALDGIAVDGGSANTIVGNVASSNTNQGISLFGVSQPQTTGNVVRGNTVASNGGDGIRVFNGANNVIGGVADGQANIARGNGAAGVSVDGATSSGNRISGNSLDTGNGAGPAIALRNGANGGQAAPAVTQSDAAHIGGTLANSAPNAAYTIEVFQSPAPIEGTCSSQAVTYIGSTQVTTGATGSASWSVAGAVEPGTVATATATSPSGNTSQVSTCLQTTASNSVTATLSVDQSTTTAGAQSFALDSLPDALFTQLATGDPSSAPIPSAPIPSAAVGASPIPSAPIPSAPIPSAPIPSAPIPSAPIPSAPIPSAPIPSAGLAGLPIPSAGTGNPLDAILLSSLPNLDVAAMFAGTSIAGKLPQQYTLGDVYRTPSALAYLTAHYHVSDLNLSGTMLRGVRTLSYLLGGKTLDQIDLGQDWCTALANAGGSCAGVDVTKTTVIGLDIMGQLGSLDLGHVKVSSLASGLNGTLIGEAYLARIAFQQTSIAQIPVSSLPAGVVSCTSCATLGAAAAANAVVDGVTLKSLNSVLGNVTLNELVVAVTPRSALPWEQESFVGWQGFGGQAQKLQYHLDWDTLCPISGLSARVRLPLGFVYVPGSSTLQIGPAAATAVADPALDPKTGATWTSLPAVPCTSGQQEHLRLNFQGEAGYKLGPSVSSAIITANGQSVGVTGAPVDVQRNWTAALDRSTEPTLQKDTIVLSHVATAGGTNYFKFPEIARGKVVTIYMKSPDGADFDLYVVRPSPASLLASPIPSAPIPSAPIPSAPIPSAPIPSADTSVNTTTDNPAPELLDDGPLPGGQVSVDSITRRAGGMEAVSFRQAGDTGFDEIAVAGYNGAFSDQPFELRVQVQDPPPLPQCINQRSLTPVQPGHLPLSVAASTQNLALVNVGRMNAMYGTTDTATMLGHLQDVMAASPGGGAVIQVDGDANVANAAAAWDASPCSIDAANNYAHAINTLVATYRATLTDLHSITIVGDDEQIPFARVADFVPTSSEFDNTGALSNLLAGGKSNATYAAAGLGYVLTDDVYGAFHTRTLFGHEFFLPEVAVGRLVETPREIDAQLRQYVQRAQAAGTSPATLDASTGFVTGYDFMSDGSKAVDDGLAGRIGPAASATNTLLRDTWGKSALQGFLTGAQTASKLNSWNAHYDYHRLMPALYTGSSDLLDTTLVPTPVSQQFQGDIFFTMGCHAGESIADTLLPSSPLTRDWAQTYSQTGAAVFVGNTGFGYGDTASVALSERLMSLLAGHLAFNGSIGEKFLQTKNEYWSSMAAYGPYDEKTLEEATFYGLPFWHVNSPGESAPEPPVTQADTGVGAGLTIAPLTITPHLTKVSDPRGAFWTGGDGTVFVPGRSVQPLTTVDVTQSTASGLVAHGFFPTNLVTDDSNRDVDLFFAKPMIDQASHEPEPSVTNDVFPASPVKVAQADYLGRRHSTLDVIAGQSRPGSKPSLHNERLITSLSGFVTYAPASATDYTPPTFAQTGSIVQGATATIFAKVSDDSSGGVIRVTAFFTNGGPWQFVTLSPVAGAPGFWSATVPVTAEKIESGFVAEDSTGNTAWMTGKGILVESITPSSTAPSITIDSPLDHGVYMLKQNVAAKYSCTGVAGVTSCAGPVASGSAIDTATVGSKTFTVTASSAIGATSAHKDAAYSVIYDFGGFQAPISSTANNVVKAGNSVPLKFSLHGNQGLNIFASGYPASAAIPCTGGNIDLPSATDTAGNSTLTYDAGTDTYTYVWKTAKTYTGCRQLLVVFTDGVVHRVNFQFK